MPSLLQIHFTFPAELMGPSLTAAAMPLAEPISREPGFIPKIWTENPRTGDRPPVPRRREIPLPLARAICRQLEIPEP